MSTTACPDTTALLGDPAAPQTARVLPVLIPVRLDSRRHGQNQRQHWAARAKATRELREAAALATVAQWPPERRSAVTTWGPLALEIVYWRARGQRPFDLDNLTSCAKAATDGVCGVLGIDDRVIVAITATQPGRDPDGTGALLLRLRAVTAGAAGERA